MFRAVSPTRALPSSMESFLADYQLVRLVVSTTGLASLLVLGMFTGYSSLVPYGVGLGVTALHAAWARISQARAPKSLLAIDITIWGSITVLTDDPVTGTAILALLFVLVVAFSDRAWRAGFLALATILYGISFYGREGFSAGSSGRFLGVLLIIGGLGAVMARMRTWFGRLEAGRSQLLGTVSHELRNNLTGLMGLTEIVSTDPTLEAAEARELVSLAHQQAVDATEIVEDLLTATRLEGSALQVGIEAVDINHEIETMLRRFVGEGLDLRVDSTEDLPLAAADPLRVRQILRNLVSNAVRYGGASIRVSTDASDMIRVTVADDGAGVPAEDVNSIFLPYRRSAATHHASSVGLGLWISRALAQAMGGTLEYNRVDGWTEFTLMIGLHDHTNPSSGGQRRRPQTASWRRALTSDPARATEVTQRR